eukprot:CAMPEP_0168314702 /NCGR_PEP_ID=MMETSP0210-20121227/9332_1 /TAXON_ID=40633 /ORGANISM="Condylostoma magnum, Strain COL2" /LENGTH=127 /DNA_ID=CAMNT_0008284777 /DNA_START=308 /DNA_END=691 /DNA_ORIENTATION=+
MVGDGMNYNSEVFLFNGRTPDVEEPFDDLDPVTMIVFGDWGSGPLGEYTKDLLYQEAQIRDFDGVLHYGDFAYDLHDDEGEKGDMFLRMIEPIAANYAYMGIPGNHEDHKNATHFKARFNMPHNEAN